VRRGSELILHGVSLSIGGVDPLDMAYLTALAELRRDLEVAIVSDHLSFSAVAGRHGHDLWPLPLTEEALAHVARRVHWVQEILGAPLALENPSTYLEWAESAIPEPEFLNELARRTGCRILLDVNNVLVSARNHGRDPLPYLRSIDGEAIAYYHLAGHDHSGPLLIDTHEGPMQEEVLALYAETLRLIGPRPTIVEWDGNLPPLELALQEVERARAVGQMVLNGMTGHAA
jgi:uncharacterized protein (UPF0276 family)